MLLHRKSINIKNLIYMYTQHFKEAVAYCKVNNLFVGYGNPNGKVLVIGKEAAHIGKEVPNYGGERPISHENPLYAYLNQYNSWDKSKKGEYTGEAENHIE